MPATTAVDVRRLGLIGALRKTIEVDLRGAFDEVTWEVQPDIDRKFDSIPALVCEVAFFAAWEAVRNVARHGRGEGGGERLCLAIEAKYQNGLAIAIEDTGAGFATDPRNGDPGDTNYMQNRKVTAGGYGGHGLALHSTMIAVIGGYLAVESALGQFTRVTLEVPESAWES